MSVQPMYPTIIIIDAAQMLHWSCSARVSLLRQPLGTEQQPRLWADGCTAWEGEVQGGKEGRKDNLTCLPATPDAITQNASSAVH